MKKCGRPASCDTERNTKQEIINKVSSYIEKNGPKGLTVRNICTIAGISTGTFYHHFADKDDLLMFYVKESDFSQIELTAPLSAPADRIVEIYKIVTQKYQSLGIPFMKQFFTTDNESLSSYMGETDESNYACGTAMARCEQELQQMIDDRHIPQVNAHEVAGQICNIVKGVIFEWCLTNGYIDLDETMSTMITIYMRGLK